MNEELEQIKQEILASFHRDDFEEKNPTDYGNFIETYKKESLAYSVLSPIFIKQGKIASFEKDIDTKSYYIELKEKNYFLASDNYTIEVVENKNRIFPAEFFIFGRGETLEERIKDAIRQENEILVKLLSSTYTTSYNDGIPYKESTLSNKEELHSLLEDLQYGVEKNRIVVDKFLLNEIFIEKNRNLFGEDTKEIDGFGVSILSYLSPNILNFSMADGRYLGARTIRVFGEIEDSNLKEIVFFLMGSMCILNPRAIAVSGERKYFKTILKLQN